MTGIMATSVVGLVKANRDFPLDKDPEVQKKAKKISMEIVDTMKDSSDDGRSSNEDSTTEMVTNDNPPEGIYLLYNIIYKF